MTTDIWTDTIIQDLSEEDLKNFQEIVLRDVKNKSFNINEKAILMNNLDLWLYSLQIIRRETELQLAQHKVNLKTKIKEVKEQANYQSKLDELIIVEGSWRNNAMKFLTAVERKTLYVKLLLDQESDGN